jgi:hypothetical protein
MCGPVAGHIRTFSRRIFKTARGAMATNFAGWERDYLESNSASCLGSVTGALQVKFSHR